MPAAPTGLRLVRLGGSVAYSDSLLLYAYRRPRPEKDTKFFLRCSCDASVQDGVGGPSQSAHLPCLTFGRVDAGPVVFPAEPFSNQCSIALSHGLLGVVLSRGSDRRADSF